MEVAKAVRSGYLLKRGEINKSWKVRWFELEDDKLKYFKSQDQTKAIDFIHLDQVVVRISDSMIGKDNCFELVTKHRVYHLVAKSRTDMEEWMRILSLYTILHSENELINNAEDMISRYTYDQACIEDQLHSSK